MNIIIAILLIILVIILGIILHKYVIRQFLGGLDLKHVAIILFDEDLNKVLMVQNTRKDKSGNDWDFPGGDIDATDKRPIDAALREFHEETNQLLTDYNILHVFDYAGGIATKIHNNYAKSFGGVKGHTRIIIMSTTLKIQDSDLQGTKGNEKKRREWVPVQDIRTKKVLQYVRKSYDAISTDHPWAHFPLIYMDEDRFESSAQNNAITEQKKYLLDHNWKF